MLASLFIILVLALGWVHTFRPGLNGLEGSTLLVARVPLLARIRMHASGAMISVGLAVILALVGSISWWLVALSVGSVMLLSAIPVSYTITDQGLRLGLSSFRRWTEFAAVKRAPGGARLIGVQKSRGMHIWLSGSRGDDEFLLFLRQTLKGAYKGTSGAAGNRALVDAEAEAGSEHFTVAALHQ